MQMNAAADQVHHCQVCHRRYKRVEHLKRHILSHDRERARCCCTACGKTFSRPDALRRHARTCTVQNIDTLKPSKRRACARCSHLKKACDLGVPCRTCFERDAKCVYPGVKALPEDVQETCFPGIDAEGETPFARHDIFDVDSFDSAAWADMIPDLFDMNNSSWQDFLTLLPPSELEQHEKARSTLSFLDNFTKQTGLIGSFDCGSQSMREACLLSAKENSTSVVFPGNAQEVDPLLHVSESIIELIREVTTLKPRNSCVDLVWSADLQELCSQFFSPMFLRQHIEMYWSVWHPNVNFLHKPTFKPTSAKPCLVAAMAIIGAAISPDDTVIATARSLFTVVEEICFTDLDLCEGDPSAGQPIPEAARVQALQAAYIVCLYQTWDGDDRSKGRIRRHRFNTLVAVARDIGFHRARHSKNISEFGFDWHDFLLTEQMIRVFLWIFLIDTAFVIFNNLPPRLVIKEMSMDMASCEAIFQAASSQECFSQLTSNNCGRGLYKSGRSLSLYRALEMLCKDEIYESAVTELANIGPLNLFAVTSSLHSMLFQYQNSFHARGQLRPLRNVLENWKTIWARWTEDDTIMHKHNPLGDATLTPTNMWQRIGFTIHASEYWLLASLLLDRICVAEEQREAEEHHPNFGPLDDDTATSSDQELRTVLQRYDETSMQQVNDLIADFQRTTISEV